MPSIVIERSSEYADRFRRYKVEVNGVVIGKVRAGQADRFEVAVGHVEVRLKIDWVVSSTWSGELAEDQEVVLVTDHRGVNQRAALFGREPWMRLIRK